MPLRNKKALKVCDLEGLQLPIDGTSLQSLIMLNNKTEQMVYHRATCHAQRTAPRFTSETFCGFSGDCHLGSYYRLKLSKWKIKILSSLTSHLAMVPPCHKSRQDEPRHADNDHKCPCSIPRNDQHDANRAESRCQKLLRLDPLCCRLNRDNPFAGFLGIVCHRYRVAALWAGSCLVRYLVSAFVALGQCHKSSGLFHDFSITIEKKPTLTGGFKTAGGWRGDLFTLLASFSSACP